MTPSFEAARLEQSIRSAFESLANELGADTTGLRVRVAPIDAEARFAYAEEERIVARAVESRRREFATARRLAHGMLDELGYASVPLLPGIRRAPAWPHGVIGSISHARGFAAVAMAPSPPFAAIGLDVEGAEPLRPELIDTVLTAREKLALGRVGHELGAWAKLAFAAKECAYKAWSPTLDVVPEFTDVEVDFDATRTSFDARWLPRAGAQPEPRTSRGRCARNGDRVFAAVLGVAP